MSERKEGKRGFWKRPFVIGAVSVVGVVAGVATIVDVFSEAGVWKAIGNGIAVAWKAVVGFMTLSTPVWAFFLLLLVTAYFLTVMIVQRKALQLVLKREQNRLVRETVQEVRELKEQYSHQQYVKDEIGEHIFKWGYWSADSTYPMNINPVCKECGCELSESNPTRFVSGTRDYLYCPRCKEEYPRVKIRDRDLAKIIQSKIVDGSYKESPYYKTPNL